MYAGVVSGSVVATVKDSGLAADHTRQAGLGDYVYLIGSKEASRIFRGLRIPADASIVGFIDTYNEEL